MSEDPEGRPSNDVGEIAPADYNSAMRVITERSVGTCLFQKRTNIDVSTDQGKALAVNVRATSDFNVPDASGMTFQAVHYLLTAAERIDESTGEISQFPWLVFVGPDGETLGTSGSAVCHALSRIIEVYGFGPWSPPIPLRFSERKAKRSGRTYHDVRVYVPAPPVSER